MNADDLNPDILQRLKNVLASAPLSNALETTGQALIKRLSSPVRVTFAGPPKVGKSTLINALAKQPIIPTGLTLPTYEAWYSDTPHIIATKSDGTTQRIEGIDFDLLADMAPVFFQLYMPLDILKRIRVLEVVTDGSPAELRAATAWAAKRSDILIWCSQTFDATEQDIWSGMPGEVQDHGFLVLTQADTLTREILILQLDHLCARMGDAFRLIAPVAAQQALLAQNSTRADKDQRIKASGLPALRAELLRDINLGRQADIDHASMFLNRFERNTKPAPDQDTPGAVAESQLAKLATQETPDQGSAGECFAQGARYLRDQARIMLTDIEELGPFAPRRIVDRCQETADALLDLIADSHATAEPQELALDAASEAADVLLLMSMENTEDTAEDAVSLLLQVQRDFDAAAVA